MTAHDVHLVRHQCIVELAVTDISRSSIEGLQTHTVVFNGNALCILSLERVPEETNSKVHGRGPHAVSVRVIIRTVFVEFGNS